MRMFRLDEFGRTVWPSWLYFRPSFSMGQGSFGGGAPASDSGGQPGGNGQGSGGSSQGGGQPQGQGQGQPILSDHAQGFLGRVAPEHQSLLQPYIQQWDAGVTRRFQDLHNQLRPWTDLGVDHETVQHAINIYQMLDENPQELVRLITEQLGQSGGASGQPQGLGTPPGEPGQQGPGAQSPEYAQLSQQVAMMQQVLEQLAQGHLDQKSQQQQQAEDAELDQYLGLLRQEFGDFDERYVLAQMMSGVDGEEAVQAFQQLVQGQVNQRSTPVPPTILGGGGAVPQQQTPLSKASRTDVKGLVANLLAHAAQNG